MKPSLAKGTRDFLPLESNKRKYLFRTIEELFKLYGYAPIETPTMENLSTLSGKYGAEGDRLLFKVLNNGDYLKRANEQAINDRDSSALTSSIAKRGLRYDLTVPFARFVVMHQNELQFPFKRYQIQPVWRADRPQKGRYQEFYQCDVDVIGSTSLLNEAELVRIIDDVFSAFGIPVCIKLNNRKVLMGIAELMNAQKEFVEITTAIDKIDKIGIDKVVESLLKSGLKEKQCDVLRDVLDSTSLEHISDQFHSSETGKEGIEEILQLFSFLDGKPLKNQLKFDVSLARGLNYYTGCIFEVSALDFEIGSLAGGGRYDNLTGVFGLKDVSGVGVSFGAERIYDVMMAKKLFPPSLEHLIEVLVLSMDETALHYAFSVVQDLREAKIPADIYPQAVKMKKQMSYANARKIPYVIIIGSDEVESGLLTWKDLRSGEQTQLTLDEIKKRFLS